MAKVPDMVNYEIIISGSPPKPPWTCLCSIIYPFGVKMRYFSFLTDGPSYIEESADPRSYEELVRTHITFLRQLKQPVWHGRLCYEKFREILGVVNELAGNPVMEGLE